MRADGDDVGRWAYPAVSGQWLETVFRVPMEAITGHQTHISLQVDTDDPDFRHYALYHLWFLQGEAEEELAEIERKRDAELEILRERIKALEQEIIEKKTVKVTTPQTDVEGQNATASEEKKRSAGFPPSESSKIHG